MLRAREANRRYFREAYGTGEHGWGEGYFDWSNLAVENQVKPGDRVKLEVGTGRWPRIYRLEKLGEGENEAGLGEAESGPAPRIGSRDEFITKLSCPRSAALVVTSIDAPAERKVEELLKLSERLEGWVGNKAD
jgi:hypothetical protein